MIGRLSWSPFQTFSGHSQCPHRKHLWRTDRQQQRCASSLPGAFSPASIPANLQLHCATKFRRDYHPAGLKDHSSQKDAAVTAARSSGWYLGPTFGWYTVQYNEKCSCRSFLRKCSCRRVQAFCWSTQPGYSSEPVSICYTGINLLQYLPKLVGSDFV